MEMCRIQQGEGEKQVKGRGGGDVLMMMCKYF